MASSMLRQLLLSQVHFGLTTRLGQLLLRARPGPARPRQPGRPPRRRRRTAGGGGLSHFPASSRARAGLVGLQAFQLAANRSASCSSSRCSRRVARARCRRSSSESCAAICNFLRALFAPGQLGQLLFRLTQFLDQSAQFVSRGDWREYPAARAARRPLAADPAKPDRCGFDRGPARIAAWCSATARLRACDRASSMASATSGSSWRALTAASSIRCSRRSSRRASSNCGPPT